MQKFLIGLTIGIIAVVIFLVVTTFMMLYKVDVINTEKASDVIYTYEKK